MAETEIQTGTESGTKSTETAPAAAANVSLRGNRALNLIYTGSFTAYAGLAIEDVVYPLLLLGFTGKPLLAGLFGTIQFTAMLIASIPAGSFVDRHDRRRVLIASEVTRALLATVLAVTLVGGHVWLAEVYLIAALIGATQPLAGARTLTLRAVAPKAKLTTALSVQQGVMAVAQVVGPAIGAVLYSIDRSLPFVAIAAGTAVSALCALAVRVDARPERAETQQSESDGPAADQPAAEGPFTGLRIIWNNPVMRATTLFIMLINLIGIPLDLVLILQAEHEGVPTHYVGMILAAFAIGGILGAPFIPRLHALLRPGHLLVCFGLIATVSLAAIALPFGGFWMAGWIVATGFVIPAAQVLVDVLVLQQVPDEQRGRVLSAVMAIVGLGMPLGAAFGGSLLQALSPATVLVGAAAAMACITLFALSQRALRTSRWPAPAAATD
ncbi:MAG TPA: MFS transporter [Actinocrinis sp.]